MRRLAATAIALCLVATAAHAQDGEGEGPDWLKGLRVRGRLAEDFAYRLHDPGDVAKLRTTGWLDGKYTVSDAVSVRAAGRARYDAGFDATDRYPANVERDQKTELSLREAVVLLSRGE